MVLVAINDTVVTKKKHAEVKRLLQSTMNRRRTLLFRDGSVHYGNKDAKGSSSKSDSSHIDIEVRSARLNRNTSKTFAEFEFLISLRVRSKLGHAINQWSLWKRYSETGDLDKRMRGQYGWQMEKVKFPPKKTFGNLDPVFLEKRREGLDFYFHEILAISDVADFKKHFSSQDLKQFIEYEQNKEIKKPDDKGEGEQKKSSRSKKSRSSRPRSNRRRKSTKKETEKGTEDKKEKGEETLALMPPVEEEDDGEGGSGGGSGMGEEYDPFVRMQKAGVPEGAIRQKMMASDVDPEPMFGSGGGGSGGGSRGTPRGPPPSAPRGPPPSAPRSARGPPPSGGGSRSAPPLPPKKASAPRAKKKTGGGGAARGGLLAAIQRGKMLKKQEVKEKPPPAPEPVNPMMAAILARRKRAE